MRETRIRVDITLDGNRMKIHGFNCWGSSSSESKEFDVQIEPPTRIDDWRMTWQTIKADNTSLIKTRWTIYFEATRSKLRVRPWMHFLRKRLTTIFTNRASARVTTCHRRRCKKRSQRKRRRVEDRARSESEKRKQRKQRSSMKVEPTATRKGKSSRKEIEEF